MRVTLKKVLLTFLSTVALSLMAFQVWKDALTPHESRLQVKVKMSNKRQEPIATSNSLAFRPKCQQNMSVVKITGFSTFPDKIQNFIFYRHCRHFPMLLDLPDKCGGAEKSGEIFLLLVIKSSPGNYDRREVLRKTWARERLHNGVWIRRIFVSGTTGSDFEKERLNTVLELEQREHNDILQWDFSDTFYNLTLKQVLFLEWMDRNCPNARFLLNGDDDVFANTDNMVEYLQGLKDNDGGKHLFTGHLFDVSSPIRWPKSKYYIPFQLEGSKMYHAYCGGGGFLLSGYTALVIFNMSKSITVHPFDDVYMGMCLAKAGLKPDSHMGFRTFGLFIPSKKANLFDPCYFKELLLVHRLLPAQVYFMWHKIYDPSLKCGINRGDLKKSLT